jgi:gluconolactonase
MKFASGLQLPEGPVALSDGSILVVEGRRGTVTQVFPGDREARVVAKTGEPNGLTIDRSGNIWVADVRPPALIRLSMDGSFERVVTTFRGESLRFPNDLCFGPDGALYLTDSGFFIDDYAPNGVRRPDWRTMPMDGRVYRIDPATLSIDLLDTGIRLTNGIAFGPDGALYVAETIGGAIYRYPWSAGTLGPREEFGNVLSQKDTPDLRGPDGIAFDANGKLYVTVYGQGEVAVLGRDGSIVERIRTEGTTPTNVCFGHSGERRIYVTEYQLGQVECFDVDAPGFPLYD